MILRKLQIDDFKKGYLELLKNLTEVGNGDYLNRFNELETLNPYVQIWILEENDKIIGTATLLLEPKFIHSCSKVGHIEDVVVDSSYQGKGLGKILIEKLKEICKNEGCYKIILDCSEKNRIFYEKCDFKQTNLQMSLYY